MGDLCNGNVMQGTHNLSMKQISTMSIGFIGVNADKYLVHDKISLDYVEAYQLPLDSIDILGKYEDAETIETTPSLNDSSQNIDTSFIVGVGVPIICCFVIMILIFGYY